VDSEGAARRSFDRNWSSALPDDRRDTARSPAEGVNVDRGGLNDGRA
jgi:hypothetical protein